MAKGKPLLCVCGGGKAHHTVEEQCWCPRCLLLPEADRCVAYREAPKQVDRNVTRVGAGHPKTAKDAAWANLPRSGSKRRSLYDWIMKRHGCTDDELEEITGWSHQSVSAGRNTLMEDGLIIDSGKTRPTRYGNDAIVWEVVPL